MGRRAISQYRKNYIITLEVGLIFSLLFFIGVFNIAFKPEVKQLATYETQEVVQIEEVQQTRQEVKAPPPPRPQVPVAVPNDEIIEDEIIDLNADLDIAEELALPEAPPAMAEDVSDEEEDEEEIFVIVEQMPELLGGLAALQKEINYPEIARIAGIEGRVMVKFVINEQGLPINPTVIRGIGGGCDEEAVRAVKKMKFKPGMQRGRPVKVSFTLPVVFKIKNL